MLPNTLLKKVIIIRAKTTCPTVILATNRTAKVIGRRKWLINSTIDKIGERAKVTPLGINLLKKFL
jgi:ribosomal protein S3